MLLQKFSIDYNGRFWAVCTKNGRYNFNFQNLCHKSAALGTGRRFTRRRRLVSKKNKQINRINFSISVRVCKPLPPQKIEPLHKIGSCLKGSHCSGEFTDTVPQYKGHLLQCLLPALTKSLCDVGAYVFRKIKHTPFPDKN